MDFNIIKLESPEIWNDSLSEIDHSYFHTWEYCQSLSKANQQEFFLLVINHSDYKIITTYSIRAKQKGFCDIYTPYGFGGIIFKINENDSKKLNAEEFNTFWKEFGQKNDFVTSYMFNHPSFNIPEDFKLNFVHHHTIYNLDLTLSKEQLWSSLQKGHKYEINRSYKDSNFKIIKDKEVLFPKFIELYNETMHRVNATDVYFFKEDFLRAISFSDKGILIGAEYSGNIVAVVLFLFNGKIGEYFLSSADENYRIYSRVLIWEGILALKEKGVEILNMGGGVTENDSLDDFKRRFGGKSNSIFVRKDIFDEVKFNNLCELNSVDINNNNYFPPYWKPIKEHGQ